MTLRDILSLRRHPDVDTAPYAGDLNEDRADAERERTVDDLRLRASIHGRMP